ncbi:unnamed protein product [Cyprideis torosa]|uniref:Adenosine kinase n=1 Tax=Cyprideis torosa TaxID=163714 RepID=A0A7R8WJL4_9CRUS|nr:unnamed protein product [Cyprideis torosa]CAG0895142.1 unnamed protein product [Cyprideis torosa]
MEALSFESLTVDRIALQRPNFASEVASVLPHVDILFGNETELRTTAETFGLKDATSDEAIVLGLSRLLLPTSGKKNRVVVMTRGADPVVFCHGGVVDSVPLSVVPVAKVVDATGCGDSLVAGFLAEFTSQNLSQGIESLTADTVRSCIVTGIRAAQYVVSQPGCSVPETAQKWWD